MKKDFKTVTGTALTCLAVLISSMFSPAVHAKTHDASKQAKSVKVAAAKKNVAKKEAPKKVTVSAKKAKHVVVAQKATKLTKKELVAKKKEDAFFAKVSNKQAKTVVALKEKKRYRELRHDDAKTAYTPIALGTPKLGSAAFYVQDAVTGKPLLEKNGSAPRPIASITKLMTAMVALDAKPSMTERLTVTEEDVDRIKHSSSRLAVGTTLSRSDMLHLALMSSENRAAHVLARYYPGGVPAFVSAMNRKAQELGLRNTRFDDPTGLSPSNIASPQDLAKMVAASARYPAIQDASTSEEATIEMARAPKVFRNTNPLVRQGIWDIDVSKTGYIQEAGRCLVMQAKINSRPIVIVLLDGVNKDTRIQDAKAIKRWVETRHVAELTNTSYKV